MSVQVCATLYMGPLQALTRHWRIDPIRIDSELLDTDAHLSLFERDFSIISMASVVDALAQQLA